MKFSSKTYTVVCDDVRQELGNKVSLMGLYKDKIIFKKLPALMPKIFFCIFMDGLKMSVPGGEAVLRLPGMDPTKVTFDSPPDQEVGGNLVIQLGFIPLRVRKSGEAKFEIRLKGEKRATVTYHFKIEEEN